MRLLQEDEASQIRLRRSALVQRLSAASRATARCGERRNVVSIESLPGCRLTTVTTVTCLLVASDLFA